MSFDEQPDGDPHGECAAEIHRLQTENAVIRKAADHHLAVATKLAGENAALKAERDEANTKGHRAINLAMEAEDRETRLATALIRAEKEREIAMAENAALRAKLDAAQKDAERYHLVRRISFEDAVIKVLEKINSDPKTLEEFDAVVDAAIVELSK